MSLLGVMSASIDADSTAPDTPGDGSGGGTGTANLPDGYPSNGTVVAQSTLRNTIVPASGSQVNSSGIFSPGDGGTSGAGTGRLIAGQTYAREGVLRTVQESVVSDGDGWTVPFERGITKVVTAGLNNAPHDEVWTRATIELLPSWEFGRTTKMGLIGLMAGDWNREPRGSATVGTARLVQWTNGDGSPRFGGYVYHRDQPSDYGEEMSTSDQPTVQLEEPIDVIMQMKMNGYYDSNGIVRIWMKPQSAARYFLVCDELSMRWRLPGQESSPWGIQDSHWTMMYGGPVDWAPDFDIHRMRFADFVCIVP